MIAFATVAKELSAFEKDQCRLYRSGRGCMEQEENEREYLEVRCMKFPAQPHECRSALGCGSNRIPYTSQRTQSNIRSHIHTCTNAWDVLAITGDRA